MVKKSKKVNEETSEQETFAQIEDLCNEPAAPTEELEEVMSCKEEKRFCPVCGGTGFVFVGEGQLERCWPCSGTGVTDL